MRPWGRALGVACSLGVLASLAAPPAVASQPTPLPVGSASTAPLHHGTMQALRHSSLSDRPVTRLIVATRDGRPITADGLAAAGRAAGSGQARLARTLARGQSLVALGAAMTLDEAWAAASSLEARPDIAWAEPDLPVYATEASPITPNDTRFAEQWDVWDGAAVAGGYSTRVPRTWADRTTGSPRVVVAVLDTGLTVHPDLTSSVVSPAATDPLVRGYDFVSGDPDFARTTYYVANDGNGRDSNPSDPGDWITAADSAGDTSSGVFLNCSPTTSSWHGTHVTGTLVAKQGNGRGISGLAPGVRVQPVRVLGRCGGFSSDINDAIEWSSGGTVPGVPANQTPASVINMSLGGPGACLASTQQAINDARSRGTTVVVAAGNDGLGIDPAAGFGSQPADCSGVVVVTASTRSGSIASYSDLGTAGFPATIAAPGGGGASGSNILSTVNPGTTSPVNAAAYPHAAQYATYAGTSMAAPHVAAAVALLQSTRIGRTPYSPDEVASLLRSSATPFAAGALGGASCTPSACGTGVLNLSALPLLAPLAPSVSAQSGASSVSLSWTPGDAGGAATTFTVEQSADGVTFGATSPALTGLTSTATTVGGLAPGTYYFRVVATNSAGSAVSAVIGPETASEYAVQAVVPAGSTEHIAVTWGAPAAGDVTGYAVRWRLVGSADWAAQVVGATSRSLSVVTPPGVAGGYEVQVAALHGAVTVTDALWSDSRTAAVRALVERVTVSTSTLRPYRDGYLDSVVVRVSTNRDGGSAGTLRIVDAHRHVVKTVRLKRASAWSSMWTGVTARNVRVAFGRYSVQVSLAGRTTSTRLLAVRPTVVVAASRAAKPRITLSTTSLFPVRDGYRDTMTITSTAVLPSAMTWKIVRAGRTYYTRSWSLRRTASATYAGAISRGGLLPAGSYVLYVLAKSGEGATVVSSVRFSVSRKRAVRTAFVSRHLADSVAKYGFAASAATQPQGDSVTGQVALPEGSLATFVTAMPSTVRPYSDVRVTVSTHATSGSPVTRASYFGGAANDPNLADAIDVSAITYRLPAAPLAAYVGGSLRWSAENDAISASTWVIASFTVTGYRFVLV